MSNRNRNNNNRNRNVSLKTKFAPNVSDVVNDCDNTYNLRSQKKNETKTTNTATTSATSTTSTTGTDNYLGEKATITTKPLTLTETPKETKTSNDCPVFDYNLVKPHRNMFVDERTIQQKISSLKKDRKKIDDEILVLEKQMSNDKVTTTGKGLKWVYKSDKPRTKYFDERAHFDGSSCHTPRVVTVVWTFNNATNVVRYGAVVWTHGHSGDNFSKYEQRMFATKRFMSNPVVVRLSAVPETGYEFIKCLRSMVHVLGVECTSKKFQKWKLNRNGNGNVKRNT